MRNEQRLKIKLEKLGRWMEKSGGAWDRRLGEMKLLFNYVEAELNQEHKKSLQGIDKSEEELRSLLDQEGKEYTQKKYKLEKEVNINQEEVNRLDKEHSAYIQKTDFELRRLEEEKTAIKVSFEKQKGALSDMFREQTDHLRANREKMDRQYKEMKNQLNQTEGRYQSEFKELETSNSQKLSELQNQLAAKREGWAAAIESLQKTIGILEKEKVSRQQKMASLRDDREHELETVRMSLKLAKEQLDIDKAALVEKAEADKNQCEKDVEELKAKINEAENNFKNLILEHETKIKDQEEKYIREEEILKDTMAQETQKRDMEQKLFEQEKVTKEKELAALKEEFERKKWQWDNQVRALTMTKNVQEAEFDAERLRVDREARALFRCLEAKRDELKQRLSDLKTRHGTFQSNGKKEEDLLQQRWNWRKERLWNMWQNRIEIMRKERRALSEQLEHLMETFNRERGHIMETEKGQEKRVDDLREFVLHMTEEQKGRMRGIEIKNELENTRILAQIKECENLIQDWMDRNRSTQVEVAEIGKKFGDQLNFIDRLYKDEERETEMFIHQLQKVMAVFLENLKAVSPDQISSKEAAPKGEAA